MAEYKRMKETDCALTRLSHKTVRSVFVKYQTVA